MFKDLQVVDWMDIRWNRRTSFSAISTSASPIGFSPARTACWSTAMRPPCIPPGRLRRCGSHRT